MKRIISILLSIAMIFAVLAGASGCGGADNTPAEAEKTAFINGEFLGSYKIVYSEENDYTLRAAQYIKDAALKRAGVELSVVKASEDSGEGSAILLGATGRELSSSLTGERGSLQFAIGAEGDEIALAGDLFVIAAAAYYFVETYIPSAEFSAIVPEEERILSPIVKEAKNFILMIGDGMGYAHTEMFDYFEDTTGVSDGEDEFFGYMLPAQGSSITGSLTGVTDSAAAATAMATGYKTYNRYIGMDSEGNARTSLTELALGLGKGAVVFSTETSTGATPASFSSHTLDRGDSQDIRAQQNALATEYGLAIGGNYSQYTKWVVNQIESDLMNAISKAEDEDGFFMMYEEAHIDKNAANGDMNKTYLSVLRFNQIIGRVMEYAFYNPDTFVLITADHETGDLHEGEGGQLVFGTEEHTGKNVPVFAYGWGSELFDGETVQNVQIAMTIASLMGASDFGDQSDYKPLSK